MKNLFSFLTMAALFLFASCSCCEPKDLAKDAAECLQERDFAGLVDMMAMDSESEKNDKALLVSMMQEKMGKQLDRKKGIESFKIGNQEIDEKKGVAYVEVDYTYGDGSTKKENMKFKKQGDKWYLAL